MLSKVPKEQSNALTCHFSYQDFRFAFFVVASHSPTAAEMLTRLEPQEEYLSASLLQLFPRKQNKCKLEDLERVRSNIK
jgi:hypothetical protein